MQKNQKPIALFTKSGCRYCANAKALLSEHGFQYEEIELGHNATSRSLVAITGRTTVPQIYIDGEYIGDSEALKKYLSKKGEL